MPIRRRRFQTAQHMQDAVDEYFTQLAYDREGEELATRKPATVTGLARHLGFASVGSLYRYENYPDQDFQWVIQGARMRVMEGYEEKLHTGQAAGAKFALINMASDDWHDRIEQVNDNTNRLETKEEKATAIAKITAQKERKLGHTVDLKPDPEDSDSWI